MSAMLGLGFVMVALFALIHAADLRRQGAVRRRMEGIQTRRGRDTLDELDLIVRENQQVLGNYHAHARKLRAQGRHGEAARRMELGCRAIEALAPDFLTALRALRSLSRTVSVLVAVEPVRPRAFRTAELRGLAALGALVHDFLLTGRQQVLLRLRVVASAFRLALRWLGRSTERVGRRPADEHAWRRVEGLVSDLGCAGDEALVAAHQIVQALDAVDLGHAVVRSARV